MTDVEAPDFEGLAGRECGEHRTLGGRAWCHQCREYCYPDEPCSGCELPGLRALLPKVRALFDAAVENVAQPGVSLALGDAVALFSDADLKRISASETVDG